jgi:hypothetical protein
MNVYSVVMDTLRGFAAHRRAARAVKRRTYVFVLVPFDFSKNGNAKRAEIPQDLIKDHSDFERAANYELDVTHEPELDFRLMWTWFLPNPLWKPKRRG